MAWGALNGWRRGLFSIVVGLGGLLLAWYLAARYAPAAAQWLDANQGWVASTARYLAGRVPLPAALAAQPLSSVPPESLPSLTAALPFPGPVQRALAQAAHSALVRAEFLQLKTVGDLVYYSLAMVVWTAISFFVIMAVTTALANVLSWQVTRSLAGTPLSALNHLAGALLGGAESLVVLVIAAGLLVPVLHLLRWEGLQQFLNASQLLPYLEDLFRRWSPWEVL